MAAPVISLTSMCVDLSTKTMKCDYIQIRLFSFCEASSQADRRKTVRGARNCCGCTEILGIKNISSPLRFGVCHYNEEITLTRSLV